MTTCAVASPGDERFIVAELLSLSASVDAWNVTTSPVFQFAALSVIEEADGVTVAVPWKNSTETTTSSLGCCDRRTVKLPTPPSFTVSFDGEATIVCGTTVTEGGVGSFTVRLSQQPSEDVEVSVEFFQGTATV